MMLLFTNQEKDGLGHILQLMLEAEQPELMLTLLRHVAERKAFLVTRHKISVEDSERWTRLADALRAAEAVQSSLKTR
jgi:hypothetical protein